MLISNSLMKTVTGAVRQKIYSLIYELLDEKTRDNISKGNSDQNLNEHLVLARDLKFSEILQYVQKKDFQMRRLKKASLEASIEEVWNMFMEDEKEQNSELIEERDAANRNSDNEVDEANLVEAKDTNALNKAVVEQWKVAKRSDSDSAEDKKRKRKDTTAKPVKKSKFKIDHTPPTITLSSLGGLEAVNTQLTELITLPIAHPELYLYTGIEPPRGILLHGPPGCGKTTIANALAGELQVPFINISAPSVVSGMSGESEKKLREIFEEAKLVAPCIIFIDEIDAITPKRDGGAQREMERRIVAQLLTLMDELTLEKTDGKPVMVIGATNRPDSLDSALRRGGRFEKEICLNVPNEDQRVSILKAMTSKLKLDNAPDFNFRNLAKMTPGYVGADLKSLVAAAGIEAIKRIFESLSEQQEEAGTDAMDVDNAQIAPNNPVMKNFERKSDTEKLSIIQRFLEKYPQPLTDDQMKPFCINFNDFLVALPSVQPSAKREGFATIPDVTWDNVGALGRIRMELHMCIVQPIKKPELFEKVGITAPAGVLMWGPPGCGKTLLAKAVANESRANFISIKGPELLNKYVGESERAIRQVFQRARASVPCIIFFDELDALVPKRDTSLSESSSRVVNTLLTELDGLNDRKGIFVIGATNRPDMIDSAMLRPGRLDKTLFIELPSAEERFDILYKLIAMNRTPLDSEVDLREIANDERCRNFSGADLSSLVREAGVIALKKKFFKNQQLAQLEASGFYEENESDDNTIAVTKSDFHRALSSIHPSVSDKDRLKYEKLNKRMGWTVIEEADEAAEASAAAQ